MSIQIFLKNLETWHFPLLKKETLSSLYRKKKKRGKFKEHIDWNNFFFRKIKLQAPFYEKEETTRGRETHSERWEGSGFAFFHFSLTRQTVNRNITPVKLRSGFFSENNEKYIYILLHLYVCHLKKREKRSLLARQQQMIHGLRHDNEPICNRSLDASKQLINGTQVGPIAGTTCVHNYKDEECTSMNILHYYTSA